MRSEHSHVEITAAAILMIAVLHADAGLLHYVDFCMRVWAVLSVVADLGVAGVVHGPSSEATDVVDL